MIYAIQCKTSEPQCTEKPYTENKRERNIMTSFRTNFCLASPPYV